MFDELSDEELDALIYITDLGCMTADPVLYYAGNTLPQLNESREQAGRLLSLMRRERQRRQM